MNTDEFQSTTMRLLSIPEAGEFMKVSVRTVYRLGSEGKIKIIKVGGASRIVYKDLLDYINKLRGGMQQ